LDWIVKNINAGQIKFSLLKLSVKLWVRLEVDWRVTY